MGGDEERRRPRKVEALESYSYHVSEENKKKKDEKQSTIFLWLYCFRSMNEIHERLERSERERGRKIAVLIERELCISWLCLLRRVGSVLLQWKEE